MRKNAVAAIVISAAVPATALAVTDIYNYWISWTPGAGPKPMALCDNGYFAYRMQNIDHGSNTVSQEMTCGKVDDFFPWGTDISHTSCQDVPVSWTPGGGYKAWAFCPTGKYATGFAIKDYGSRNEAIYNMRCCGIAGASPWHESTYATTVSWYGGAGAKGWSECGHGYLIAGVRVRDYGGNNQAISDLLCAAPE